MNKYLENSISGFFLGLGIAISLGVAVFIFDKYDSGGRNYETIHLDHLKISVSDGRLTTYGRSPMINILVTNNLDKPIDEIYLVADLFDTGGLFGTCSEFTDPFKPNESREILIECHKYESTKIPEDTKFKVRVARATKDIPKGSF